ncbi:Fc receptor-like B isoform X1 [Solea solea]|uniref:Fc receptor-like B isoform X1 n=1 Tax=Solea solea TaxID=90069 RepID=UPI00272BEAB0|nr:Fc receptor-like B isoform X1 [Solea solea]
MERSRLPLLLCLSVALCCRPSAAHLSVRPVSSQFFSGTPVSLSCWDNGAPSGQTLRRNTSLDVRTPCDHWGQAHASFCVFSFTVPLDSGVYWCESRDEVAGDVINITVTDALVILQSPALPVTEGQNVTLTCKTKAPPSDLPAAFYKDGFLVGTELTRHMTIQRVSKSNEGTYRCDISGMGESPSSWIRVTGNSPGEPTARPLPPDSTHMQLVLRLICHLVVFCPYCISTALLVLLYQHRARGGNRSVSMATDSTNQAEKGLAAYDVGTVGVS